MVLDETISMSNQVFQQCSRNVLTFSDALPGSPHTSKIKTFVKIVND